MPDRRRSPVVHEVQGIASASHRHQRPQTWSKRGKNRGMEMRNSSTNYGKKDAQYREAWWEV